MQEKLEAQYAAKRDAQLSEIADLKQLLEVKAADVRNLNATIESLKSVNEELKVFPNLLSISRHFLRKSRHQRAFAVTSAGIEGGKNLAESAQDLERARKAISVQLAEFDGVKKSLMRDLQNRCEKVCSYSSTSHHDSTLDRSLSWKYNLTRSKSNTTTLFATATAKRNRRRWHS